MVASGGQWQPPRERWPPRLRKKLAAHGAFRISTSNIGVIVLSRKVQENSVCSARGKTERAINNFSPLKCGLFRFSIYIIWYTLKRLLEAYRDGLTSLNYFQQKRQYF